MALSVTALHWQIQRQIFPTAFGLRLSSQPSSGLQNSRIPQTEATES